MLITEDRIYEAFASLQFAVCYVFISYMENFQLKYYIKIRRDSLNEPYIKYFSTYIIKYQNYAKSLLILNTNTRFKDIRIFK